MKAVAAKIMQLGSDEISGFEKRGTLDILLDDGETIRVSGEELEIQRTGLKGWSVETEKGITVALDTELTEELIREGLAREFINRVQNMRKEADYDVTDRILIGFKGAEELIAAIKASEKSVGAETLAEEIRYTLLDESDFVKIWDIGGKEAELSIRRTINH